MVVTIPDYQTEALVRAFYSEIYYYHYYMQRNFESAIVLIILYDFMFLTTDRVKEIIYFATIDICRQVFLVLFRTFLTVFYDYAF